MGEFTAQQIFESWFYDVREDNDTRYIHRERPEMVGELASLFKNGGIEYEEATMFTKKVVNTLTTDEGRKGRGKYKGWKECVEEDYRAALASRYVDIKVDKKPSTIKTVNQKHIMPEDQWINAWLQNKFGDKYPNEIKDLAHTVGSSLNTQFLTDIFESDWVQTEEKIPKWLIG